MNHPTACCAAPGSYCARTDRLVGLDGVHVTDVARTGQESVLTIETPARLEGCGVCGVVAVSHGRRVRLTSRAIWWAIGQLRTAHATVAGQARALGVDWHTLWAAIRPRLEDLAADESRFAGVVALGVDEHVWHHTPHKTATKGPTMLTGMVDLTRDAHGRVRARLLDLVPGRTGKAYADWLTERSEQFRYGVQVATLDPFRGYANAIADELDDAVPVLDAFHVVGSPSRSPKRSWRPSPPARSPRSPAWGGPCASGGPSSWATSPPTGPPTAAPKPSVSVGVAGLGLAGQDGSGRVDPGVTHEAIGPLLRCPSVELSARAGAAGTARPTSVTSSGDCPTHGSWLITDLPRSDLFPDRYRPLGDRVHFRLEEGASIAHGYRRANTSVRHRRGHPRPQPRRLDPGLPPRRDPRRCRVPRNQRWAGAGGLLGRTSHRWRPRRAVGDRGHGHLRRPSGPRCRRRRIRRRRGPADERTRQPRDRQVRPAGRPPHRGGRPTAARDAAAPATSRRWNPSGRPRPARLP